MNGTDFTVPEDHVIRMIRNVDYYDNPRPPYQRPVPDADGDIFIPDASVELDGALSAEIV